VTTVGAWQRIVTDAGGTVAALAVDDGVPVTFAATSAGVFRSWD